MFQTPGQPNILIKVALIVFVIIFLGEIGYLIYSNSNSGTSKKTNSSTNIIAVPTSTPAPTSRPTPTPHDVKYPIPTWVQKSDPVTFVQNLNDNMIVKKGAVVESNIITTYKGTIKELIPNPDTNLVADDIQLEIIMKVGKNSTQEAGLDITKKDFDSKIIVIKDSTNKIITQEELKVGQTILVKEIYDMIKQTITSIEINLE